jgi:hypothetical protein
MLRSIYLWNNEGDSEGNGDKGLYQVIGGNLGNLFASVVE